MKLCENLSLNPKGDNQYYSQLYLPSICKNLSVIYIFSAKSDNLISMNLVFLVIHNNLYFFSFLHFNQCTFLLVTYFLINDTILKVKNMNALPYFIKVHVCDYYKIFNVGLHTIVKQFVIYIPITFDE